MKKSERKAMKAELERLALAGGYDADQVREYVSEAEHQDGDGYWDNFANAGEAYADFKLYWDSYVEQSGDYLAGLDEADEQ
jgi:hypothetical protein